jgi:hypothetical protein
MRDARGADHARQVAGLAGRWAFEIHRLKYYNCSPYQGGL